MICMDWDTEMTGKPLCRATRSAVRCRVPVSSEKMEGSGMRCTAACRMREASLSRTIAPSIFASSRSPVAVNGMSRKKPPVEIESTVLSLPSTSRAPVRPRRMRSSPSRRVVPGAMLARVARSRRTSSVRSLAGTSLPVVLVRSPFPALVSLEGIGSHDAQDRSSRTVAGRVEERVAVADPEVQDAQGGLDVGHTDLRHRADLADDAGVTLGLRGDDGGPEPEPRRLGQSLGDVSHAAQLPGEAELPDRHQVGGDVALLPRRRDGYRPGEVGRRLDDPHT